MSQLTRLESFFINKVNENIVLTINAWLKKQNELNVYMPVLALKSRSIIKEYEVL